MSELKVVHTSFGFYRGTRFQVVELNDPSKYGIQVLVSSVGIDNDWVTVRHIPIYAYNNFVKKCPHQSSVDLSRLTYDVDFFDECLGKSLLAEVA